MPGDPVRFGIFDHNGISPEILPCDKQYFSETAEESVISSNSLFCFTEKERKKIILIGGGTFKKSEGTILLRYNKKQKTFSIIYQMILDGLKILPEERKELDKILIIEGSNLNRLLRQWAEITAEYTSPRIPTSIPTGWNDWQFYRNEKTQQDVLDSAEVIAELKSKGYPLDFIQVDGGYCMHLSEWTQPRPSFSDGIKKLSEKIKSLGLKFGIWLAPYIQNKKTCVVKKHPDWMLRDKSGQIIELPSSNVGNACLIDYSIDEPIEWLRGIVKMFVCEWNAEWIKLDGPNYALYRMGILRNSSMTITEMVRRTFQVIREEAGSNVLVEGEGMMGAALGKVDLHRVQTDNHTKWYINNNSKRIYAPQVFGKELIMSFLHNKWWCNHRENIILRDFPSPYCHEKSFNKDAVEQLFTEAEFKTQLASAFLSSGGLLLCDPMKYLKKTPYRMKYISQMLPVWPETAEIVDEFPENSRYPSIYILKPKTKFESYAILGIINWSDEIKNFSLSLSQILDKNEYHAFSFFREKYLGLIKGNIEITLTAHTCELITLKINKNRPQLLSTSMHFIQGAVELEDMRWDNSMYNLFLNIKHFEQNNQKLFIYIPEQWQLKNIDSNAIHYSIDDFEKECFVIKFTGKNTEKTFFNIEFRNSAFSGSPDT